MESDVGTGVAGHKAVADLILGGDAPGNSRVEAGKVSSTERFEDFAGDSGASVNHGDQDAQ
jgi:hypothetical protein